MFDLLRRFGWGWSGVEKNRAQSVPQFHCGLKGHSQVSERDVFWGGPLPAGWNPSHGGQRYADIPLMQTPHFNPIEKNERGILGTAQRLSANGFIWIGHDGKPRSATWDEASQSYVKNGMSSRNV